MAAEGLLRLEERHTLALPREEPRGGEPADAGSDHGDRLLAVSSVRLAEHRHVCL